VLSGRGLVGSAAQAAARNRILGASALGGEFRQAPISERESLERLSDMKFASV
jgi:hypothetical protein